ncbi:ammonium transporter [Planoprotostelium fungivorum]|uniref:Ammonium transporter n=1 Tax=Planoprotostelium fungivorum TaxID=1890364 RepID=A0A2P6NBV4_9EUKA|nr:ammonium transporter [Planoprotostelium fungivorum]
MRSCSEANGREQFDIYTPILRIPTDLKTKMLVRGTEIPYRKTKPLFVSLSDIDCLCYLIARHSSGRFDRILSHTVDVVTSVVVKDSTGITNLAYLMASNNCPSAGTIDSGDTAFVIFSAALVFIQTPAVGFFYGGMVRRKNMLNTIFLSFAAAGVVMVQWALFGYSISFGNHNAGIGNWAWGGLKDVSAYDSNPDYAPTIPHLVYSNFQMMFAAITPALISGAVVERVNTITWLIFVFLWTSLVYDPLAHWVWAGGSQYGADGSCEYVVGWLRNLGAIDFAGGTVIHISSGIAALAFSLVIGKRHEYNFSKPHQPASIPFTVLGTTLLWFGWVGFNGGSALSAGPLAALAAMNTTIAAASGFLTWLIINLAEEKGMRASFLGALIGVVVGLVAITPASGYSILFGVVPAFPSYILLKFKHRLPFDDSLDVFFCHGVGGIVGSLMTGLFATQEVNPAANNGAFYGNGRQFAIQLLAVVVTVGFSGIGTAVLALFLKYTIGLKVSSEAQMDGMDKYCHGEEATNDNEMFDRLSTKFRELIREETNRISTRSSVSSMSDADEQTDVEMDQIPPPHPSPYTAVERDEA